MIAKLRKKKERERERTIMKERKKPLTTEDKENRVEKMIIGLLKRKGRSN